MPVSKKRKTAAIPEGLNANSTTPALSATTTLVRQDTPPTTTRENTTEKAVNEGGLAGLEVTDPEIENQEHERQERFKALQARAVSLVQRDVFHTLAM